MTIRRITVEFVGPDGVPKAHATGSVDRRAVLIREARAELEKYRRAARFAGDASADDEYTLNIVDAPAAVAWSKKS